MQMFNKASVGDKRRLVNEVVTRDSQGEWSINVHAAVLTEWNEKYVDVRKDKGLISKRGGLAAQQQQLQQQQEQLRQQQQQQQVAAMQLQQQQQTLQAQQQQLQQQAALQNQQQTSAQLQLQAAAAARQGQCVPGSETRLWPEPRSTPDADAASDRNTD